MHQQATVVSPPTVRGVIRIISSKCSVDDIKSKVGGGKDATSNQYYFFCGASCADSHPTIYLSPNNSLLADLTDQPGKVFRRAFGFTGRLYGGAAAGVNSQSPRTARAETGHGFSVRSSAAAEKGWGFSGSPSAGAETPFYSGTCLPLRRKVIADFPRPLPPERKVTGDFHYGFPRQRKATPSFHSPLPLERKVTRDFHGPLPLQRKSALAFICQ